MSIEEKNTIMGRFYYTMLQNLHNMFGVLPHEVSTIGNGTQGTVISFQSKKAQEGFEALAKQSTRIHGPWPPTQGFPEQMALKIQIISKTSGYAEKRMLREEYIMHYLNRTPTNNSVNAPTNIVSQAVPKLFFGCTVPFEDKAFFRLTFMELLSRDEYMTVERILATEPALNTRVICANVEKVVKALWRLKVSHNDLSIRNVMVKYIRPNIGEVRLIDFGLADILKIQDMTNVSKEAYERIFANNTKNEQRGSNVEKMAELCALLTRIPLNTSL